jgi:MoaD family protein
MEGKPLDINVKIRYLAVLRGLTENPERTLQVKGNSFRDLLNVLNSTESAVVKSRLFLEGSKLRPDIIVFINNTETAILGGEKAELKEGDEVVFLPSVHGG